MTPADASTALYKKLRDNSKVMGVAVREKDTNPFIVIYLQKPGKTILNKIPKTYQGYDVKVEYSGQLYAK